MIKELANNPYNLNFQVQTRMRKTIEYLKGKIESGDFILDVGQQSPLTDLIERVFNIPEVWVTDGDLDYDFKIPNGNEFYDKIVYSHTIEHVFNPLWTLEKLKMALKDHGKMYVMAPARGKLLWTKLHYHEIDDYRFRLLFERAGLRVTEKVLHKIWRPWRFYFTGIKPLYRLFREFDVIYELEKK